ncbi:MAG: sugar ABC transporter permease [Spirochaetota bacterium]
MNYNKAEARLGIGLMGPSLALIVLLIIYPLLYNILISFFDVALDGSMVFIGLENYSRLLSDPDYWNALGYTVIFLLGTVLGTTLVGLGVALLLNEKFVGRNVVRVVSLLPYFVPVISVVFAWKFIFDPVIGIYNYYMVDVWGLTEQRINMASPRYGLMISIIFDVWKRFAIATLLIFSRLQSINRDYYEAASIDGAGPWKRFIYITLPEISFVLGTIVLLRFIWNLNAFDTVFLISSSVKTVPVYAYYEAFTGSINQDYAATISVLQLVFLALFIWFYVKKVLKW